MEYTLKTLTALGLICLALNTVHAEDALKKCDCGNVAEDYFSKCAQQSEVSAMKTSIPTYAFQLGLNAMESEIEKFLADLKDKIHLSSDIKKDCAALSHLIALTLVFNDTPQHLNKDEMKMFFRLKAKEFFQGSISLSPTERKVLTGLLHTQSDRKPIRLLRHENL